MQSGVCEIRWCKQETDDLVPATEIIGDGAFCVEICRPCANALGVQDFGTLPESETVKHVIKKRLHALSTTQSEEIMTDQAMVATHKPSMNLRFVERVIDDRKVKILQQMFVPDDWANHPELEEFWQDIPLEQDAI